MSIAGDRYCTSTVTDHPTAAWTSQQIVEAFADREPARYLIRDRDTIYGHEIQVRIASLGIEEVLTASQSPRQNPHVERLIGSIRRDCLNHFVILNSKHLKKTLSSYFLYYHESRDPPGVSVSNAHFPGKLRAQERSWRFHNWADSITVISALQLSR